MDQKELEKFRAESETVLKGIKKLEKQIEKYKTGAEAFAVAAEMMGEMNQQQGKITEQLEEYIGGLYELDTEKIIEVLKRIEGDTAKIAREVELASKTTGELLPMVNDLWGMTEDLERRITGTVKEISEVGERISRVESGYEAIEKELKRRAEEEGAIRERMEEGKIWIDRLIEKMGKMEGVAQRIENSEKRIEEKIKAMK